MIEVPACYVASAQQVKFSAHVELMHVFLTRRSDIVACIDRLLNCQKKPIGYQQNFLLLSQQFIDCFFAQGALRHDQASLRDELEQAHWASGFKPRANPGNEIIDPVEQMLRAFHLWRQTHWPGSKGRLRFAHTLFNLYLLRRLTLLCMRVWDGEPDNESGTGTGEEPGQEPGEEPQSVAERLCRAQEVLDALWNASPADQPKLVRDVRWLFPVAMSPTTDSLAGYFRVARRIAETFSQEDRIETQKAWVQTGAGHLRSQLRDLAMRRDVSVNDKNLMLITRMSNALDVALLVQGLVTLLEAYERCLHCGDEHGRSELASAIQQGISPDPDLFVNRLDLLQPYSMIEHLFITADNEGEIVYTATGQQHLTLLQRYAALLDRLAQPLYDDCRQNRPAQGAYSPYGVLFGFASNLIELMAFKSLQRDALSQFSIEDAFTGGGADKLAWVNGWRDLPHIKAEVVKQFAYPHHFAEAIGTRIEKALQERAAAADAKVSTGRLFVVSEETMQTDAALAQIPDLPLRYIVSSDPQAAAGHKAEFKDSQDLLHCRLEGEFVVSYETAGGWLAITKDILTEVLGAGRDAKITGLPRAASEVLRLMCPDLVVVRHDVASNRT